MASTLKLQILQFLLAWILHRWCHWVTSSWTLLWDTERVEINCVVLSWTLVRTNFMKTCWKVVKSSFLSIMDILICLRELTQAIVWPHFLLKMSQPGHTSPSWCSTSLFCVGSSKCCCSATLRSHLRSAGLESETVSQPVVHGPVAVWKHLG